MHRLAIVVPCYNEEAVFAETAKQLTGLLTDLIGRGKIASDSYILFVNDGSSDGTWRLMQEEYEGNPYVNAVCLTANAGQQNALLAGLTAVYGHCDMAVSLDADLQDDIGVMEQMIDLCMGGVDVVYGVRNDRSSDSFFKRTTAHLFYRLMTRLGTKTVYDHAEYRLMSARALGELLQYRERELFVRGIVPLMGLRSEKVYYARKPRTAGKSKYSPGRMAAVAVEGITSLSLKPIALVLALGLAILAGACAAMIVLLMLAAFGTHISGWVYVLASVWLLGGLLLASLGVVGEYIGRIFMEVKGRPRYHVDRALCHGDWLPVAHEQYTS